MWCLRIWQTFGLHRNWKVQTPWSRVLLEKLIVFQEFKKFPSRCRIWSSITVFARASHWSLYGELRDFIRNYDVYLYRWRVYTEIDLQILFDLLYLRFVFLFSSSLYTSSSPTPPPAVVKGCTLHFKELRQWNLSTFGQGSGLEL